MFVGVDMRVADEQIFGLVLWHFQQINAKTVEAEEQVSTGKRVTLPSDDPVAFGNATSQKESLAKTQQWLRNIDSGLTRANTADSTLGQVTSILTRIKELTVQARSDTTSASERALIATEVRSLDREVLRLANTEVGGQRIFAGTKADADPFTITSGDTVQYLGNDETQSIAVGNGQTVQITLPGSQVFAGPTTDIFDSLKNLLAALETNNGAGIETGVGDMDRAIEQITNARGQFGTFENRLDSTKTTLSDAVNVVQKALSQSEDVDLTEAVSNLTRQQMALQAAAASAKRIFDNSLLNFLQ